MLKQIIIIALIALGAQAQTYCQDQNLRCLTAATTRPESEGCRIREQACLGSNIWVTECPKAAVAVVRHHHHEKKEKKADPIKSSVVQDYLSVQQLTKCKLPCNNNWIICDEGATTNADMVECMNRKNACLRSRACTWVPMCPATPAPPAPPKA